MNVYQLKEVVTEFLALVRRGSGSSEEDEKRLALLFSALTQMPRGLVTRPDQSIFPAPPALPYQNIRDVVERRFPSFGSYDLSRQLSEITGQTSIAQGNALDDMTVIASALFVIHWRFENTSLADALVHLEQCVDSELASRLCRVQLYLQARRQGVPN